MNEKYKKYVGARLIGVYVLFAPKPFRGYQNNYFTANAQMFEALTSRLRLS